MKKCKCCHCECIPDTDNDGNESLNNIMTKDQVEKALYLKYGICIKLLSNEEAYNLENRYRFYRTDLLGKYPKEFMCRLKYMLYRNYYWIDTRYKALAIYDNLKKYIKKNKMVKNKDYYIICHMDDGYDIKFYPRYINEDTKTILHYFDMSWFTCPGEENGREFFKKIIDYYENNDEYTLEYFVAGRFEHDFD